MFTDPNRKHATDPGNVINNPDFIYLDAFSKKIDMINDYKNRYTNGTVSDIEVKHFLASELNILLEPIRNKRIEYEAQPEIVT